ncbi:hypothetical protein J6590_040482 [Homalodisca vitripennis]|nr:hypothetical protein J6590_040482 [Homalodisca vitripennis]
MDIFCLLVLMTCHNPVMDFSGYLGRLLCHPGKKNDLNVFTDFQLLALPLVSTIGQLFSI